MILTYFFPSVTPLSLMKSLMQRLTSRGGSSESRASSKFSTLIEENENDVILVHNIEMTTLFKQENPTRKDRFPPHSILKVEYRWQTKTNFKGDECYGNSKGITVFFSSDLFLYSYNINTVWYIGFIDKLTG